MPANYTSLSQIVATEAPECQPISVPAHPADNDITTPCLRYAYERTGGGYRWFRFNSVEKQLARLEVTIDALRVRV